jgi:hypothetical protein
MGRLSEEIGTQEEYSEKGSWPEYFQFVLIIRRLISLIRILKTQVARNEFSFWKIGATEISRKCQNKERNCYNQKNLYTFESFLHV